MRRSERFDEQSRPPSIPISPRDVLVARAFGATPADESHRARLRVEVGRLCTLAGVSATKRRFALMPRRAREVVLLAQPVEEQHAAVLAFLAGGDSSLSPAVALALGASQRTVQRALDQLAAAARCSRLVAGEASDDPARAGIHDDLVTPRSTAE